MDKLERSAPVTADGQSVYRLANQKFADPKQLIEAVEEGGKLFQKNHMDIRDYKATLNDAEKSAYEIGVFRALEEKLGTPSGRNFLTEISKTEIPAKHCLRRWGQRVFASLLK